MAFFAHQNTKIFQYSVEPFFGTSTLLNHHNVDSEDVDEKFYITLISMYPNVLTEHLSHQSQQGRVWHMVVVVVVVVVGEITLPAEVKSHLNFNTFTSIYRYLLILLEYI